MENEAKRNTVVCSSVVDKDLYNKFKSVCYRNGLSVKECLVSYMKTAIEHDTVINGKSED